MFASGEGKQWASRETPDRPNTSRGGSKIPVKERLGVDEDDNLVLKKVNGVEEATIRNEANITNVVKPKRFRKNKKIKRRCNYRNVVASTTYQDTRCGQPSNLSIFPNALSMLRHEQRNSREAFIIS